MDSKVHGEVQIDPLRQKSYLPYSQNFGCKQTLVELQRQMHQMKQGRTKVSEPIEKLYKL